MTLAPQIAFRNMKSAPKLEEAVLEEAKKLDRFCPRIISCRVAIEAPKRREGGQYRVKIDLCVPGEELVVEREASLHSKSREPKAPAPNRDRSDAQVAIHEAFHEMRRQLQDSVRKMRAPAKPRERLLTGKVTSLSPGEGFGFIEGGLDGEAHGVYFHRDSVLGDHFGRLRIGSPVRFAEEAGEKGPQASSVRLVRPARQGREAAASVPLPRGL